MSNEMPSFETMQNYKFGFGRALYNYLSTILSMPHSFKYEELDKNGVYYGLYTIIAMRVPDIKSYHSMELSGNDGGIEKELYLAAKEINAESEYELVVNKSSIIDNSTILYPNNYAVFEEFQKYAEKRHNHEIDDINELSSELAELTNSKQDKLISGETIKTINNQNMLGSGNIHIEGGGGGTTSYNELEESTLPKINKTIMKGELDSHQINVPLWHGEVIVNRLAPQAILVDVGVLWVDCRKIRAKTTEDIVFVLVSAPTTEKPYQKIWEKYNKEILFTTYEEGAPIFPEAEEHDVGSILIDHNPAWAETKSDIYMNSVNEDSTAHYWRKLSSQDGYMKDPSKPTINGVDVAGARTSSSYGLQDKLEAGYNIKKIQVGESEPQSLLDNPDQPLVVTGGGGTSDYNSLVNIPEMNEIPIKGRLGSVDLGIPLSAEKGNCIIARSDVYHPMLNIDTIYLDVRLLMLKEEGKWAKKLDWKEMGSTEKVWVSYGKNVIFHQAPYLPDIGENEEGTILVLYDDNLVPVYWQIYRLERPHGSLAWKRMNVIYGYSQIPDKPLLNGNRIAGEKTSTDYGISTIFVQNEGEEAPSYYQKGDLLAFKKDDNLISLKCCIKDSEDVYSDNDWMLIPTGKGTISTYAEAPDKPEIEGHVLNAGNNNTYESLNIAKNTDMENCKSEINVVETAIGSLGVRIDADENNIDKLSTDIDNINAKICTDFFKTSTIKSPSCKAIADYITSVLNELDGSEEEF